MRFFTLRPYVARPQELLVSRPLAALDLFRPIAVAVQVMLFLVVLVEAPGAWAQVPAKPDTAREQPRQDKADRKAEKERKRKLKLFKQFREDNQDQSGKWRKNTAQSRYHGLGFRFATEINRFYGRTPLGKDLPLIDHAFSNVVLGPFYKNYRRNFGYEVGINWLYKSRDGFPFVMDQFARDPAGPVSLMALEAEIRFGPRLLRVVYPKIGFQLGYRWEETGFVEPGQQADNFVNGFYWTLPVGVTLDFPTSFGTTGVGLFYEIGLFDILSDVSFDAGGKMRSINFEIHVLWGLQQKDVVLFPVN